jgi:hypothetical protein
MDNFFHRRQGKESGTQPYSGFSARLQIFTSSILSLMRRSANWLEGLTKLTEEEQEEAGIYPCHPGDE